MSLPFFAPAVHLDINQAGAILTFNRGLQDTAADSLSIALPLNTAKELSILLKRGLKDLEARTGVISNINWAALRAAPEDW